MLWTGPASAECVVLLAHGAGAPMDSPFMESISEGLAAGGVRVGRFEFPYMQARREGSRRPPDREPVLRQAWLDAISEAGSPDVMVIGGKSLGGRIASMIADEAEVDGLICLGYPFHPPGQPAKKRTAHLESLRTPALILQGTRDPFGLPEEVLSYPLAPSIRIQWVEDGDHSFKPRKSSRRTLEQNLAGAVEAVLEFVRQR